MTGRFWLDWAMIAVSLFNTILMLWLGLTVLFNANRRDWGVWVMGGGLLMGATFFCSHSAILGQELTISLQGLNSWWRVGWFLVTITPFAWYVAVLWFSGFWAAPQSAIQHPHPHTYRHSLWLWLMVCGLLALTALLVAYPTSAGAQLLHFDVDGTLALRTIPHLFLLFPLWIVACVLLSIDVLSKHTRLDTSSAGATSQVARLRAQPWLLGTAGALLAVCLVVSIVIASLVATASDGVSAVHLQTIARYDLLLALLIALALFLLGQAIVSYEIFTGRVLPRRSFVRHWRNALILAGAFALVVGGSIAAHLRPIYSLLLATLLLTLLYALTTWRAFGEREHFVARLRPFVQSQSITPGAGHAASSTATLVAALCRDVLGTAHAQLVPLGSMAPLVTTILCYPAGAETALVRGPRELSAGMTALDATEYAPYRWAISLWDERGRIGALLIGDKTDGGLYSQEEMEIAQATGERILQLLASEQMLQRLMELQRTRTVEQRVVDLQMRRTLHDEILPALHLAVLQLSGKGAQQPECQEALHTLANAHRQIATLLTKGQPTPIRTPDPCNLVTSLRTLIDTEFRHSFTQICWHGDAAHPDASQDAIYVDALVGEVIVGAAREVIRNAALHARGSRTDFPLQLDIELNVETSGLTLSIIDNGIGIDSGNVIASTGGSGSGLALHSTLLAMVGGHLTIESPEPEGTVVKITVTKRGTDEVYTKVE